MKRAQAAAAVAALLALAACGDAGRGGGREDPTEGIAAAVEDLESALAERDFGRVCEQVFSPEGRRRAGGEECPRRLARTSAKVEDPELELVSVTLEQDGATARVRAYADGERPAIDVVRLVPAGGRYRIESLSRQ